MKNLCTERDYSIDMSRVLGIFLVILAHCIHPSFILHEIRTFDVVLLVFISGISFELSYSKNKGSYGKYIKNRFVKLVFHTWLFLILYYSYIYTRGEKITIHAVVNSFLLIGGIGYLWIFRVMFINAIINPFLIKFQKNKSCFILALLIIVILFINDEIYRNITINIQSSVIYNLVLIFVHFTISYGSISFIGIIWNKFRKIEKISVFILITSIFVMMLFREKGFLINENKNPPQMLYISYGLMCSFLIYETLKRIKKIHFKNIILFISKNSMTIYLFHIIALSIVGRMNYYGKWYIYYLYVLCLSLFSTYLFQVIFMKGKK